MSEAAIEVRRLTPAEGALFRDIRLEGLQSEPDAFASTYESESAQPPQFFADRLARTAVYGAFRGEELLGVAGFAVQQGPKHGHKGTMWGMFVRPVARQAGIAQRLVEAVIAHARREVELLQLSVISENVAARRLYARLGFAEYGHEKHAAKYQGRYHDDVLMQKMLTALPSGESER